MKSRRYESQNIMDNSGRIKETELDSYNLCDGSLKANVAIKKREGECIKSYFLEVPKWKEGTEAFVEDIKAEILKKVKITTQEALNIRILDEVRGKFLSLARSMILDALPHISEEEADAISRKIIQDMLGLGDIEFFIKDDNIEEICVNGASQPIWVYHRKHGWLKTNISIASENQIWNYASAIARGAGRQINVLSPFLDAYLPTGDRVNATLFPISYFGNTITIRKFARKPWTITDYLTTKTLSLEVAAILWLAVQYETNILISGGTGSGKTSLLNVLSMFIPPNQRVTSIEQTRELTLPPTFQWVPLVVREPTSEGMGKVSMLDLLINSLRMRPDRILVGEIRREEEAQVLFEAIHTGHSVCATMHAETVSETVKRLLNPPFSIPPVMVESLHLIIPMYRDRKSNIRRIFEIGEVLPSEREGIKERIIYRWRPYKDAIVAVEPSVRFIEAIKTYTNISDTEIKSDLKEKEEVLQFMVEKNINSVEGVGNIISDYYDSQSSLLTKIRKKQI
ncbi:MAG: ATPase, T2SS/T4P/T4SS family [Candidatus Anstonellales archaeon]